MKKYKSVFELIKGRPDQKPEQAWDNLTQDPEKRVEAKKILEADYDTNLALMDVDLDQAYTQIQKRLQPNTGRIRSLKTLLKYAALITLTLTAAYFSYQNLKPKNSDRLLVPKEEAITITLDNGEKIVLEEQTSIAVAQVNSKHVSAKFQNNILEYDSQEALSSKYNTIKTPYGKQLELVLSDGTRVHLNAGTTFRYPISFPKKGQRQVYLEGEAYFEVAKNKSQRFLVTSDSLNIAVFGTQFNVSAFKDDPFAKVVLVEGSVGLTQTENEPVMLLPNEMGAVLKKQRQIAVTKVNTELYTAWRKGYLIFRNASFDNIMRRLERQFNIEITNNDKSLGQEQFDASFNNIPIDSILHFFNDAHKIDFRIEDNKVFIDSNE
jgi:ferric-dicitrate binding protein FerR (iron transport regulator)